MRNAIEEELSSSFDVVASVANGRHAIEATHRLDPDVVVLDISMPVLDGISAARELVRGGTRAKVLLLSVHDADKYVAAAVDAGAQGYVAKPRLATDLEDAITHVLRGRLRLPTSSVLLGLADPRTRHAVQVSPNDDTRVSDLHDFAGRALRRGDAVVAIARRALLDRLASRLAGDGFDLESLGSQARYQVLELEQNLPRVMRGGELDEAALVALLRSLEEAHAASASSARNLVVFGEGAPLLLQQGYLRAAVALERIWHGNSGGFHTLCSYCRADMEGCDRPDVIDQLYAAHQAISA